MSMSRKNLTAKVARHVASGGIVTCQAKYMDPRSGARKLLWVGRYEEHYAILHKATGPAPRDTQWFDNPAEAAQAFVELCGAYAVEWEAHYHGALLDHSIPSTPAQPLAATYSPRSAAEAEALRVLGAACKLAHECLDLMGHSYTYATFAALVHEALVATRQAHYLNPEWAQLHSVALQAYTAQYKLIR